MKTDKLLQLIQQKKFMRSGGALPLPKHQWVTSQVLSQPGPTKAKADFANSSSLGMATQNAGNILNAIMSNKKNQPFINFIDTRTNDPVVPGKKLEATRKHDIKGVSRDELNRMVNQARKLNVDPADLITVAGWETNIGQTDPNLVHDLYQIAPTEEGLEGFDAQANMAAQALNRQLKAGKRKYPAGPFYKQMQAFQGYGNLYPNTEGGYYGHDNQAFFGIPVTRENPLRTNVVFPYGKTIESFRDSVVIPTLEQYGIEYKEQGGLTRYQTNGEIEEDYTEDQKRERAQWLSGQELYDWKEKLFRENNNLITGVDYGPYGVDYYHENDPGFLKVPKENNGFQNERLELIRRMQNPAIKLINRLVAAPDIAQPYIPESLEEVSSALKNATNLKKDASGLFPVQPTPVENLEGPFGLKKGGLTKAQSGQTVSELWKQVTGSDWSKAKELGVTDGSYEKNMELRNALAKYVKTQPQPKKESQPAAPKYPWSPGGKYAHTDNKRLVVDKQRKPDVVPPSRINALVADAMNQNNPTPVDAIPNMNMKAVQDIANLNSKVVNRDDTKVAPKGSTRSKLQNALNYVNEAVENTYGNPFMNPAAKWVYDAFVGAPAQSALNIANTVKGDRPIRNDQDIANLGWDAAMVAPYVGEGLSLANKGRRALAFNAIDPVGYGAMEKLKRAPRTFMNNVFINPEGRAARIGEALDAHASPISQTNLGKRRLDAWNIYLQRPQQYNTFTKIGDNTYRMNNPIGYDKPERFESIMDDVDNLLENQGIGNKYVVEKSKHPGFSFSQYRDDVEGGIMGGYRVDVSPTKSNNLKFRIADTWDIRPWEKRGNIYADPKIANNPAYQQALMKNYNKFLKDIEIGPIVGGKPFNIENNILYNPNKVKVIRKWEEGGELTSEKAIEILQDGTLYGKPLTAAQKRYFTIIANKNKRNG